MGFWGGDGVSGALRGTGPAPAGKLGKAQPWRCAPGMRVSASRAGSGPIPLRFGGGWAPRDRSFVRRERWGQWGFRAGARGVTGCRRSSAHYGPIPLRWGGCGAPRDRSCARREAREGSVWRFAPGMRVSASRAGSGPVPLRFGGGVLRGTDPAPLGYPWVGSFLGPPESAQGRVVLMRMRRGIREESQVFMRKSGTSVGPWV